MIDELLAYTKRYNEYDSTHYTANKKITAAAWNALWLAVVTQGNQQEDTLASILNITIPEVITNINNLITLTDNHTDLLGILQAQVTTLDSISHTHANKLILDDYTLTNAELTTVKGLAHEHANSSILANTTASFKTADRIKLDSIEIGTQVNIVTSVAGKIGDITLTKSDVGLENVDNTSDLNKPVSTATLDALDNKVDKEIGKGLSTNDYTTQEKEKLASLENYDDSTLTSAISGKADKVSSAVSGNFAGLDSGGNLIDSGSKASDFLTNHQDISGKVAKTGDTMTGSLIIENAPLKAFEIKNTTATEYARQMFTGNQQVYTQGVGNSSAPVEVLRNNYYIYDYTNGTPILYGNKDKITIPSKLSVGIGVNNDEAVNKGQMDTSIATAMSNIDVPELYDIVVRTPTDFATLTQSPTWLGATSVAFIGNGGNLKYNYTGANGIKIPQTVKEIKGYDNAIIRVSNFVYNVSDAKACMYYHNQPLSSEHTIQDITLEVINSTSLEFVKGFYNFCNMTNCKCLMETTLTADDGEVGFEECANLTNCEFISLLSTNLNMNGFVYCRNLVNCSANIYSEADNNYISHGFESCTYLVNCNSDVTSISTYFDDEVVGFNNCYKLSNCIASCMGAIPLSYVMCEDLSNCQGTSSCYRNASAGDISEVSSFQNCKKLSNCTSMANSTGTATTSNVANGFDYCEQLSNCIGTGQLMDSTGGGLAGYAYKNCSYGSNNRDMYSATGATTGTMLKWSTETND